MIRIDPQNPWIVNGENKKLPTCEGRSRSRRWFHVPPKFTYSKQNADVRACACWLLSYDGKWYKVSCGLEESRTVFSGYTSARLRQTRYNYMREIAQTFGKFGWGKWTRGDTLCLRFALSALFVRFFVHVLTSPNSYMYVSERNQVIYLMKCNNLWLQESSVAIWVSWI